MSSHDIAIVGGGFFGASIAAHFARQGKKVVLFETEPDLLRRASLNNQARVHGGYHYPRSFLTANRSKENFDRFLREYGHCVVRDMTKVYAVARQFSQVSAEQFETFFRSFGAPIEKAPARIRDYFEPDLVEEVFLVQELAFDAGRLRQLAAQRLHDSRAEVRLGHKLRQIARNPDGTFNLSAGPEGASAYVTQVPEVFVCTYSGINSILKMADVRPIPLKHELTEMAVVGVPDALENLGITVMDGPFFSVMPYPPDEAHTLSHVRYTPHLSWEEPQTPSQSERLLGDPPRTNFDLMKKDASRYAPILDRLTFKRSIWEIKTLLPRSEMNDSRPILLRKNYEVPGIHVVLGGKIDNVFDILEAIQGT